MKRHLDKSHVEELRHLARTAESLANSVRSPLQDLKVRSRAFVRRLERPLTPECERLLQRIESLHASPRVVAACVVRLVEILSAGSLEVSEPHAQRHSAPTGSVVSPGNRERRTPDSPE